MTDDISIEASSEYLRLTLPLLAKYKLPVTPKNFTVWFDHVSGHNQPLSEAINALIQSGEPIDAEVSKSLFERYYGDAAASQIIEARRQLEQIIAELFASLDSATEEVARYEHSLTECGGNLDAGLSVEQLRGVVAGLVDSTHRMHESSHALQDHLAENQKETERLRIELKKARAESRTDPMTGLLNRKGFDIEVKELRNEAEFHTQHHCVMIGDIDHFKGINDAYGHIFGDKVIKIVAKALTKITKGKDLVARFGGEEFVVLFPDTDIDSATLVAENIRMSLEKGRIFNPKTGEEINRVTISIGVSHYDSNEDVATAIARADEVLYQAKADGRNRVVVKQAGVQSARSRA